MDKEKFKKALDELKKNSPKRNFTQSVELIVNLKDLNMKIPEEHVDIFTTLPHSKGKDAKVCALVGPELEAEAKANCHKVILQQEFDKYKQDKKSVKKLAEEYDFFIAQANIMGPIATAFGAVLGPRKKMPNPKSGCIVPPKVILKPIVEKLNRTVRLMAKDKLVIQVAVAKDNMKEEDIIENLASTFNTLVHGLPKEINNVKEILVKYTMSKPVKVV